MVNSDRTALIQGPYNTFLMQNAAKLIVSALPSLARLDDPARPLDMFPRELDSREDTARPLVDAVWDHLGPVRIVADGAGELQALSDLTLHPIENDGVVKQWSQLATPDVRAAFVHPTCYRGQRLNRLKFLLRRAQKEDEEGDDQDHPSLEFWLEQVASPDPTRARQVFQLVKQVAEATNSYSIRLQMRRAKVIPTKHGKVVDANSAIVATGVVPAGKHAVLEEVAADNECLQILEQVFGVKPLDGEQWRLLLEQALLSAENAHWRMNEVWTSLWSELRHAPQTVAFDLLSASIGRVRVRNGDQKWVLSSQVLRPGSILGDDPNIASVLLDSKYHANDEPLLGRLNIRTEPRNELIPWNSSAGDAYRQYEQTVRSRYTAILAARKKYPQWSLLDFVGGGKVLAGAPLLPLTPSSKRGKLTALLLDRLSPQAVQRISFGHTTRDAYDPIHVPSPTCWLLAHHGVVDFGYACVTVPDLVMARTMPSTAQLPGWTAAFLKLDNLVQAFFGEWHVPAGDLKSLWSALFSACESLGVDVEIRRQCYEAAAAKGQVPSRVPTPTGLLPLKNCYVTSSGALAAQAEKAGVSVSVLSSEASNVWCTRGAKNLADIARIEHDGTAPDPLSLLDVAPEIDPALTEASKAHTMVLGCKNLRIQIGDVKTPLPATLEGGNLLVDVEQLAKRSWQERLTILVHEAINAGWIQGDAEQVARDIVQKNYVRRRAEVASKWGVDYAERKTAAQRRAAW